MTDSLIAKIERAIGGYEEGAWVPESSATIEHIALLRKAAERIAALQWRVDALERMLASLADCINQELRESGQFSWEVEE